MTRFRAVLTVVAAVVVFVLAVLPVLGQGASLLAGTPRVLAAGLAGPRDSGAEKLLLGGQEDNEDEDNDEDDEDNDDGDDEDDEDNDDGDDDEDDEDDDAPIAVVAAPPAATTASSCIAGGGNVSLTFPGGSAAVTNPAGVGANVRLEQLDPAQGPGGMIDQIAFSMNVDACPGGGAPPDALNLGITFSVGVNKANVRIVRLEGGQWVDVPTVPDPDPNKPYVSATIPARSGGLSVVQR